MTNIIIQDVEDFFTGIFNKAKEAETIAVALTAGEVTALGTFIQTQIGPDVMALAKALMADFKAGDSWTALEADLIAQALTLGKTMIQGAATVALNTAQSILFAQATPAATAPATTPTPTPTPTA